MTRMSQATSIDSALSLIAGLGGPVVWLHCDTPGRLEKLVALSEAVLQAQDSAGVLLSYPADCAAPVEMPRRLCLPCADNGSALVRKIAPRVRIAAVLLATRSLSSGLVTQLLRQGTRVLVAEMPTPRTAGVRFRLPGHTRRVLNRLTHVYLASEQWRASWRSAGMPDARMSVIGTLSQAPMALHCNERERESLADSLRHRTVWLAAGVPIEEEAHVMAVQRDALRESHRLALILHPADPRRGPELYARYAQDFTMALRSRDDPITPETQVYIADTEGERGLWYRLAVACYLGGSLTHGSTFSPLEAAGLGCAVVHGPEGGPYGAMFDLLTDRKATRRVTRPADLSRRLRAVLRPEQAADMAHRGWQIVSEGSEATETLVTALLAADRE